MKWIDITCLMFLGFVLSAAVFYASNAFGQTVIAECRPDGVCFTTREVLELMLNYIQQLEVTVKGKCA